MQRNFIDQCEVIRPFGVGQNAHIRSLTVTLNNYQLFYFWKFCPIRMGVLPVGAHFAPVLNFALLYYNKKRYKVVMHYVWKGN